ncbi:MAG TPA: Gfo/Idh/MocA family oxidoreductase [Mycobacteriales bacterium]|nr:Gfo/Idh/MocA family oxidoreductase [Mycobacteriales bacterium]
MDRVRMGIVGIGNIAQLNVRGYLQHEQCDVVALCDPREDKAAAMAAKWGVPHVETDLAALLARDDIDAVEILTPTHLHRQHVEMAAAAGKHVSVQKPAACSVADARAMAKAAEAAGITYRVTDNSLFTPPMVRARQLVRDGAIGEPSLIRIRTVVGQTDTPFQNALEPQGYVWRFNQHSPGGHLFDDVVHKYALALWLVDEPVDAVQAVVRQGPVFFETPSVMLFEYARPGLLGSMDVTYAPDMYIRSRYYGADEFVEIQGTEGFIWVTRHTGEMLDLPPLMLYRGKEMTSFADVDGDWGVGFDDAAKHFVDNLLQGTTPDMRPELAERVLQLCFAVYQASAEQRRVDPRTIDDAFSPPWWPLFTSPEDQ